MLFRSILIVTIAIYLLQSGVGEEMISSFALWPLQGNFLPWQLLTYAFLHSPYILKAMCMKLLCRNA